MKHLSFRLLSLTMSALLVFGALPTAGFAAEKEEPMRVYTANIPHYFLPANSETVLEGASVDFAALKTYLAAQFDARSTEIDIGAYNIPNVQEYVDAIGLLIAEELPEYFHVKPTYFYSNGAETHLVEFEVTYSMDAPTYAAEKAKWDNAENSILAGLKTNTLSELEKALLVHDRLALWCEYDERGLVEGGIPTMDDPAFTAYATLVLRESVCQGYAQAYRYLLGKLGIECLLVPSNELVHEWNMVKLDGKWYHVDVTHDDPVVDVLGQVTHSHFLVSTAELKLQGGEYPCHNADDFDTDPVDTTYDNYIWENVTAAFQLLNGEIYYIDGNGVLKTLDGTTVVDLELENTWLVNHGTQYWPGVYSRLYAYDGLLFYNGADGIYAIDPADPTPVAVYTPEHSYGDDYHIYGFAFDGTTFTCEIANTPNFGMEGTTVHEVSAPYVPLVDEDAEAVEAAKKTVDDYQFEPVEQSEGNVAYALLTMIKADLTELTIKGLTVEVTEKSFTAAIAGDGDDVDGTDGVLTYTITVSKGEATYTTDVKTAKILATPHLGNSNADWVAQAKADFNGGTIEVAVDYAATQTEITAAVQAEINAYLADNEYPDTLTMTVSYDEETGVYTCQIQCGKSSDTCELGTVTVNRGENPNKALAEEALNTMMPILMASVLDQKTTPDEASARAQVKAIAEEALNNPAYVVGVSNINFSQAGVGTQAEPEGIFGKYSYGITVMVGAGVDAYTASTTSVINIRPIAYADTDQYKVDQAKETADEFAATLAQFTVGNDLDKIKDVLRVIAMGELNSYGVGVTVSATITKEAVAGTVEDLDGENGLVTYTITISYGTASYTTDEKTAVITATPYTLTDEDYVNAAKTVVDSFTATAIPALVPNTEDVIAERIRNQIAGTLDSMDLDSYTINVGKIESADDGDADEPTGVPGLATYTITVKKGNAEYTTANKTVTLLAADYDGKLNTEILAEAKAKLEEKTFITSQKNVKVEEDVAGEFLSLAETHVGNNEITITLKVTDFKAAVAGTADTKREGDDGYAKFTFTLKLGSHDTTTKEFEARIIANEYTGVMNADAVAQAKAQIEGKAYTLEQADAQTQSQIETWLTTEIGKLTNPHGIESVVLTIQNIQYAVNGDADNANGTNGTVTYTVTVKKGTKSETTETCTAQIRAQQYTGPQNQTVVNTALNALVKTTLEVKQEDGNTLETIAESLETRILGFLQNYELTDVAVTIDSTTFQPAVEGSADTTKAGTPGSVTYSVTLTKGTKTASASNLTVTITATPYTGKLNSEVVAEAKAAVEAYDFDLRQNTAGTEESAVLAHLEDEIDTLLAQYELDDITVTVTKFEAPVAATAASDSKIGKDGKISFTVLVKKGTKTETATITDEPIDANDFSGMLDSEAIAEAQEIVDDYLGNTEFKQAQGNDAGALKTRIAKELAETLAELTPSSITVEVTDFEEAEAGSADSDKDGKKGSAKITVTVVIGSEDYTKTVNVEITATPYTGTLNADVVAEAKAAVEAYDFDLRQNTAGTEESAVLAHLEDVIDTLLARYELDDITVTVTHFEEPVAATAASDSKIGKDGKISFTVLVKKGTKTETATITDEPIDANDFSGMLDSEAIAEAQEIVDDYLANTEFKQAQGNDAGALKTRIAKELAETLAELTPSSITVEVTDFEEAEAGSAATTHEGKNGGAKITVTVVIGTKTYKAENVAVVVTATEYKGLLDSEAIEDAEDTFDAIVEEGFEQAEDILDGEDFEEHLEEVLAEEFADLNPDEIIITVTEYTAPTAGSADSTHEGTAGSAVVTITIKIGTKTYYKTGVTIAIAATPFTGVLDKEAVDKAEEELDDAVVIIPIGATQAQIDEAIEDAIADALTGDAEGVTATVEKTGDTTYTITLTKGAETTTVTVTVEEEEPEELGVPTNLEFRNGIGTWKEAANAESYLVRLYQGGKLVGEGETTDTFFDFSKLIAEDKAYTFTVTAKGNGVTTVDSPESALSDTYKKESYDYLRVWQAYLQMLLNQKFTVIADAGVGGTITQEGKTMVKYDRSVTYKITALDGYAIEDVLVDGKSVGAISEYTFRNVKANHTIVVTFAKTGWENPFTDLSEKADYYDAVRFVYENELFIGVSATRFAPDATMTRAMFVTVLGRLAGVNTDKYAGTTFTDCVAGEWYAPYVQWAAEKGIVNGYGNGRFGVDDEITVEQAAVIIARYADYAGLYKASSKSLDSYQDAGDVADWAAAQMKWALEHGIYEADGKTLAPKAEAKRSLVAEMLYAFVDEFTD